MLVIKKAIRKFVCYSFSAFSIFRCFNYEDSNTNRYHLTTNVTKVFFGNDDGSTTFVTNLKYYLTESFKVLPTLNFTYLDAGT